MILEGNLGAFPFEDILKYVRDRRQSGTLEIDCAAGQRRLAFDSGRLVYLHHFEDFAWLGRGLVGEGIIDREDYYHLLDETAGASSAALKRLATTRRDEMAEHLAGVLEASLDDELFLLSRSREGGFRFYAEVEPCPEPLRLAVEAEAALARGREILTAWVEIAARHEEIETGVFQVEPTLERSFQEVRLSPRDWRVLAGVNGRRDLSDLARLTGLGYWQSLGALDRLLSQRLIAILAEPPDAGAAAIRIEEREPARGNGGSALGWLRMRAGESEPGLLSGPEALALLCNRLLERLPEAAEAGWLPRAWSRLVSYYPLADMIDCAPRRVDAGRFARLRERFAGGESENAALEETERALAGLAVLLLARLREQLGARKADALYAKLHLATLGGERSPLTATRLAQVGLPAPAAK